MSGAAPVAGLAEDTAAGTRRICRLNPAALAALRDQLGTRWQRAGPARTSEAGVRFCAESPTSTRVEREHRHIGRPGPGWEAVTGGVDGPAGWPLYLDRYAALVKEAS